MTEYTIGFNAEERLELLEIFKDNPKWLNRIKGSQGFQYTETIYKLIDNGILPSGIVFKSFFETLPDKLDIGRRIKVKNGNYLWRTGKIKQDYINGDDCSSYYGKRLYLIRCDTTTDEIYTNDFTIYPKDCEFID